MGTNYIDKSLQATITEYLRGIDPSVFLDIYLHQHPDQSQASMAKPKFGMTPAAFGKALKRAGDHLREDWVDAVLSLMSNNDLIEFERKANLVFHVQELVNLQTQRESLYSWIPTYLRSLGMEPYFDVVPISAFRVLCYRDRNSDAMWFFVLPHERVGANGEREDYSIYSKILEHYNKKTTLAICTTPQRLSARNHNPGLPSKPSAFLKESPQIVLLELSENYSEVLNAYSSPFETSELEDEDELPFNERLPLERPSPDGMKAILEELGLGDDF